MLMGTKGVTFIRMYGQENTPSPHVLTFKQIKNIVKSMSDKKYCKKA